MTTEAVGISNTVDESAAELLKAKRVVFIGKLGGLTKREARALETRAAEEMSKLTGGLQLPPGMKLPF